MLFQYKRTIHFHETDAAGVVYFANLAILCHEAYEASLENAGISLKAFFTKPEVAVPITHLEVDFLRPLTCGDRIVITLAPKQLTESKFEIAYLIALEAEPQTQVGRAVTHHVCIDASTRSKVAIPPTLQQWLAQF